MVINSDINILGGLPDWSLIEYFYDNDRIKDLFTSIKTIKSINRFEKAIRGTLLSFKNGEIKSLFDSLLNSEGISEDTLYFLFWNAAINNELFHAINMDVYFEALYKGRISLRTDEILAFLNELKKSEDELKRWGNSTLKITASKYLTLLKKFNLLEGRNQKSLQHPFLSDKMFIIFIYWINEISEDSNILRSEWLNYSFLEVESFIHRIKGKQFTKYFDIFYTGDKLKVETKIEYGKIYEVITGN